MVNCCSITINCLVLGCFILLVSLDLTLTGLLGHVIFFSLEQTFKPNSISQNKSVDFSRVISLFQSIICQQNKTTGVAIA